MAAVASISASASGSTALAPTPAAPAPAAAPLAAAPAPTSNSMAAGTAWLMSARPPQVTSIRYTMNTQNVGVRTIWEPVMSTAATVAFCRAFSSRGFTYSGVGSFMMKAAAPTSTTKMAPSAPKVMRHPSAPNIVVTTGDNSIVPPPKPMSMAPEARPCLSGNHFSVTDMTTSVPRPTPAPTNTP